jgi:hypothetical protein
MITPIRNQAGISSPVGKNLTLTIGMTASAKIRNGNASMKSVSQVMLWSTQPPK